MEKKTMNLYASGSKSKGQTFKQAIRGFKKGLWKQGTHTPVIFMDDPKRTWSKMYEDLMRD